MTNPKQSPESIACIRWLQGLVTSGISVMVPEIADYEVRLCQQIYGETSRLLLQLTTDPENSRVDSQKSM